MNETAAAIERVKEAMKLGLDALTAIQARMQKVPEVQGREFVSLGIQTVNAISVLSSPRLVAELDRLAAVPVKMYTAKDKNGDTVTAYVNNMQPGVGSLTLTCYGRGWTAFWGSMSGRSVEEFVSDCGPDYTAGCLVRGNHGRLLKSYENKDYAYVVSLVEAIRTALPQSATKEQTA